LRRGLRNLLGARFGLIGGGMLILFER
jgi:hypothetical protein